MQDFQIYFKVKKCARLNKHEFSDYKKGGEAIFSTLAITLSVKNASNMYITNNTLFFALDMIFGSTKNMQV